MLNTPGTIDADYRGEVQVLLINLGEEPVAIDARHADRPDGHRPGHPRAELREVDALYRNGHAAAAVSARRAAK